MDVGLAQELLSKEVQAKRSRDSSARVQEMEQLVRDARSLAELAVAVDALGLHMGPGSLTLACQQCVRLLREV